jgi:hypothetical protein
MVQCRRRLWLLSRPRSGAAFPAAAVAQRSLQGFVEKVPLVRAALLPLHVHRLVQAAPCLSNSALRPVARTTMASADSSRPIGNRRRPPAPFVWRDREISQGKTLILRSSAAGFTCARVRLAFGLPRPLPGYPTAPASYPMSVRQLRVLPPACSPPVDPLRGSTAATQLPLANGSGHRPVEDLHLQDQRHAWHTVVGGRPSPAMTRGAAQPTRFYPERVGPRRPVVDPQ